MSGTSELADLYSAVEESARRLDVPCSRDRVWPVLRAYGDLLPQATVAFRVATGERHAGDLDCRFTMLPKDIDPYARALANRLTTRTGHPSDTLNAEIRERFPIECHGIDFGVLSGFTKTWQFFPPDEPQKISRLAGLPSMPLSLGGNASLFARYGLDDKVGLTGIDHRSRTVNVYFGALPAESLEPAAITAMVRDTGLPDPSEELVSLGREAFGIYVTLRWDSARIERICFAVVTTDLMTMPARPEPEIVRFVQGFKYGAADQKFVYAITATPYGEYCKVQAYYQWRARMMGLLLSDSAAVSWL